LGTFFGKKTTENMLRRLQQPALAPDLGLLLLRLGVGILMLLHGYEKLQGFMRGEGADWPDPLHVGGRVSMGLTIFAEFFCSILLMLGLATRAALIMLLGLMIIIVFVLHGSDPLSDREHAILFLIPYFTLFFTGPGKYALDEYW
jgi:putative oxidoreductase